MYCFILQLAAAYKLQVKLAFLVINWGSINGEVLPNFSINSLVSKDILLLTELIKASGEEPITPKLIPELPFSLPLILKTELSATPAIPPSYDWENSNLGPTLSSPILIKIPSGICSLLAETNNAPVIAVGPSTDKLPVIIAEPVDGNGSIVVSATDEVWECELDITLFEPWGP